MLKDKMILLRKKFIEAARTIDDMASLVDQRLAGAGPKDWIDRLAALENRINQYENELDFYCTSIISLYAPEASDLRTVLMVLKMNTEVERTADLIYGVGKAIRDADESDGFANEPRVHQLFLDATRFYREAIDMFAAENGKGAQALIGRDDAVDAERHVIINDYLKKMNGSLDAAKAFTYIKMTQKIERMADHAANICEDVYYMVEGQSLKHHQGD